MIAEHFDAVRARLAADPDLTVHTQRVPRNPDGSVVRDTYVVLYGGAPDTLDDRRFTAPQTATSRAEFVYTARSISATPEGLLAARSHVLAALAGAHLDVEGRSSVTVALTHTGDADEDDAIKPPLFFADDEYTAISIPI